MSEIQPSAKRPRCSGYPLCSSNEDYVSLGIFSEWTTTVCLGSCLFAHCQKAAEEQEDRSCAGMTWYPETFKSVVCLMPGETWLLIVRHGNMLSERTARVNEEDELKEKQAKDEKKKRRENRQITKESALHCDKPECTFTTLTRAGLVNHHRQAHTQPHLDFAHIVVGSSTGRACTITNVCAAVDSGTTTTNPWIVGLYHSSPWTSESEYSTWMVCVCVRACVRLHVHVYIYVHMQWPSVYLKTCKRHAHRYHVLVSEQGSDTLRSSPCVYSSVSSPNLSPCNHSHDCNVENGELSQVLICHYLFTVFTCMAAICLCQCYRHNAGGKLLDVPTYVCVVSCNQKCW